MVAIETTADAAPWLVPWTRDRHLKAFADPRIEHLLVTEDGDRAGLVLIADLGHEHRTLELQRIVIAAPGQGLGRRAIALALDRCFELHGARRVWLDLKPDNQRGRRAYTACGFVFEATLRDMLRVGDAYEPLEVMSVLEPEWAARRKVARFYELFNARDLGALIALMRADVDWPNAFEGGRVHGREAVRDYWQHQFGLIDPRVEPVRVALSDDGAAEVRVHQVVNDLDGDLIGQGEVLHVYRFDEDGLVARMDVVAVEDER